MQSVKQRELKKKQQNITLIQDEVRISASETRMETFS